MNRHTTFNDALVEGIIKNLEGQIALDPEAQSYSAICPDGVSDLEDQRLVAIGQHFSRQGFDVRADYTFDLAIDAGQGWVARALELAYSAIGAIENELSLRITLERKRGESGHVLSDSVIPPWVG